MMDRQEFTRLWEMRVPVKKMARYFSCSPQTIERYRRTFKLRPRRNANLTHEIKLSLTKNQYEGIQARVGLGRVSAYIRNLIEKDLRDE